MEYIGDEGLLVLDVLGGKRSKNDALLILQHLMSNEKPEEIKRLQTIVDEVIALGDAVEMVKRQCPGLKKAYVTRLPQSVERGELSAEEALNIVDWLGKIELRATEFVSGKDGEAKKRIVRQTGETKLQLNALLKERVERQLGETQLQLSAVAGASRFVKDDRAVRALPGAGTAAPKLLQRR